MLSLPRGFEPLTPRLTVVCSDQLSYGRIVLFVLTRIHHEEVEQYSIPKCIEWGLNPRSLRYQILSLAP